MKNLFDELNKYDVNDYKNFAIKLDFNDEANIQSYVTAINQVKYFYRSKRNELSLRRNSMTFTELKRKCRCNPKNKMLKDNFKDIRKEIPLNLDISK